MGFFRAGWLNAQVWQALLALSRSTLVDAVFSGFGFKIFEGLRRLIKPFLRSRFITGHRGHSLSGKRISQTQECRLLDETRSFSWHGSFLKEAHGLVQVAVHMLSKAEIRHALQVERVAFPRTVKLLKNLSTFVRLVLLHEFRGNEEFGRTRNHAIGEFTNDASQFFNSLRTGQCRCGSTLPRFTLKGSEHVDDDSEKHRSNAQDQLVLIFLYEILNRRVVVINRCDGDFRSRGSWCWIGFVGHG